ncbi:MAG: hypothetical protein IPO98_00475 [Saprospiraceae bacterium]|nr:hypothetical protein [Saprospiraceae bacterium]
MYINKSNIGRSIIIAIFVLILAWVVAPLPHYKPSYSRVLYSSDNVLLSATTSSEQQWCFPMDEDIPENLKKCIIIYEDEYFAFHPE